MSGELNRTRIEDFNGEVVDEVHYVGEKFTAKIIYNQLFRYCPE